MIYPVLTKVIESQAGELHFKRWCWFWTPWFAIYTHYIAKNDMDPPHNHPWNFLSLILWGGYIETVTENKCENCESDSKLGMTICCPPSVSVATRMIGSVSYRNRRQFHNFKLIIPTYTLVATFGREQSWGHLIDDGIGKKYLSKADYRKLKNELRDENNRNSA